MRREGEEGGRWEEEEGVRREAPGPVEGPGGPENGQKTPTVFSFAARGGLGFHEASGDLLGFLLPPSVRRPQNGAVATP